MLLKITLFGVFHVGKRVGELLVDFVLPEHNWKITLFNNWNRIIGSLKDKVFILKIEKNLLVLGVLHSTWAQELFMLSDELKKRINSIFKEERTVHGAPASPARACLWRARTLSSVTSVHDKAEQWSRPVVPLQDPLGNDAR